MKKKKNKIKKYRIDSYNKFKEIKYLISKWESKNVENCRNGGMLCIYMYMDFHKAFDGDRKFKKIKRIKKENE